jgi:hypothetical protein
VEHHAQATSPRGDHTSAGCLTRAPIVELQRRQHRLSRFEEIPFDPEITEGTEVWTHRVPRLEEWLQLSLQLRHEHVVSGAVIHLVTSDEQSELIRELLDCISDIVKPPFPNLVLVRPG